MKIAIVGSQNLDSLESNLQEAFCFAGHSCQIFDIHDRKIFKLGGRFALQSDWLGRRFSDRYDRSVFSSLANQIEAYSPDLVIGVYRFIHPSFVSRMKKTGCMVIHINPDALTTFEFQQLFASDYDVWFTKDPYIVRFMRDNMHLNAKFYNEAFNVRNHRRPDVAKEICENEVNIDVMTYGTMYPYRCRMLKAVIDAGIDIKVFGVKPNRFYDTSLDAAFQNRYIAGPEKSMYLYGSKIVFNQMHYAEIESVNNRFFEANGSGAFQLCDYRPILKELLPVDPEAVSFRSIDEGIDKIKYYLDHDNERIAIAQKVYDHFVAHYSYDSLVEYILSNLAG